MNIRSIIAEEIRVKTRRADRKAVIVRTVNPKTGEMSTRTKRAPTGEIRVETAQNPEWVHEYISNHDVEPWILELFLKGHPIADLLLLSPENREKMRDAYVSDRDSPWTQAIFRGQVRDSIMTGRLGEFDVASDLYDDDEEEISEGELKVGKLLLDSGESVLLSREDVDALTSLLGTLTPNNREKMQKLIHKNSRELDRIKAFAKGVRDGV